MNSLNKKEFFIFRFYDHDLYRFEFWISEKGSSGLKKESVFFYRNEVSVISKILKKMSELEQNGYKFIAFRESEEVF